MYYKRMNIFFELTSIIVLATVISVIMKIFKQPFVVGYIFAGILAGPYFFHLIHSKENIELFAKIGITILLFIVGLHLNPKVIKEVGKIALIAGLGQIISTAIIGFFLSLLLGIAIVPAIYISVALAFSSTIIIMKLLSDKTELNKVHGKIAVGILLVQDVVAILSLVVVSSIANVSDTNLVTMVGFIVLKGALLLMILYLATVHFLPKFSHFIASTQELLFLFSITWGLGLASIFYLLGFSIEVGALLAGVSLASLPFADIIASRMRPLRDFFIVLFFILLGSEMKFDSTAQVLFPALVLSAFILFVSPIIVFILMDLLGYKRKTGFQVGVALAQISEFSLILVTLAFTVGHIDQQILSLVTLVGVITIAGSSYLILHSDAIYPHVVPILKLFEFRKNKLDSHSNNEIYDIVFFGFDRVGHDFIDVFSKLGKNYLVVDYNPALIHNMEANGIPFKFGDAEDIEFLNELNLDKVKMVVSTIPDLKTSRLLVKKMRAQNPNAILILLSHDIEAAKELYAHGATYVIMPHYLGSKHASDIIHRLSFDVKEFEKEKEKHLAYIEKRKAT